MKRFLSAAKYLGLALTTLIVATSCQKDPIPDVPVDDSKLVKFTYDGEEARFSYNADGTIKEAIVTDEFATGGEAVKYTISYNAQKKISEVVTSENKTITPTYQGNNLAKVEIKNAAGQVEGETTYTYTNGKVTEALFSTKTQNTTTPWLKFTFKYNAQDNVIEIKNYMNNLLNNTLELAGYTNYTYDNKPNPLHKLNDFLLFVWQVSGKNNVTKEEHFLGNNTVDEVVEYTYNYNSFNKPVTAAAKRTVPGNPVENYTLQYSYAQ